MNLTSKGEEVYKVHQVFHEEMICAMLSNFSDEEEQVLLADLHLLQHNVMSHNLSYVI